MKAAPGWQRLLEEGREPRLSCGAPYRARQRRPYLSAVIYSGNREQGENKQRVHDRALPRFLCFGLKVYGFPHCYVVSRRRWVFPYAADPALSYSSIT